MSRLKSTQLYSRSESNKLCKILYGRRKIGVVSSSYEDLLKKIRKKLLLINKEESIILQLEDGTEIDDDYYEYLEENAELFLNQKEALYQPLLSKLELFLNEYTKRNMRGINEKLTEVYKSDDFLSLFEYFGSVITETEECLKNRRVDHPGWFQGLNTKFTTKCGVMCNSAETRIRSYLQKLKTDMGNYKTNENYLDVLQKFQSSLKAKRHNSSYFDRTASVESRLCSEAGQFQCFGAFNCESCVKNHYINPYASKESRIMFSTWNLDHVIEKSRTVIPALKEALDTYPSSKINVSYFFDLLFEHRGLSRNGNLKLVHIVCHDKAPHEGSCDSQKIFISENDAIDGSLHCLKKRRRITRETRQKRLKSS